MSPHPGGFEEDLLGAFDAIGSMRRLMGYMRNLRALLAFCVLGSMLTSAIQIVSPLLVREAVDRYMAAGGSVPARIAGTVHMAALYAALLALNLLVGYGVSLGLNHVGQQVVMQVRTEVWRQFHRLPIAYFDRNPIGRLVTRVANDATSLSEMFTSVLATGVGDVILFVGIGLAMVRLNLRLTLVLAVLFPGLMVLTWWFKNASARIHRRIRVLLARVNAFFQENVQGLAVVKSFVAERRQQERFHALNLESYRTEMELVHVFAIFRPLVSAASTLGLALVLWQGGRQVMAHDMSLGTLVAFLFYVRMLFAPIDEMAEKFNLLQAALVASERIFRILDEPAEADAPSRDGRGRRVNARELTSGSDSESPTEERRIQGHIVFEDVHFAYEADKPVLRGVSFEIRPGETVALVGPTGSGKTTVTGLLMGFYRLAGHGSGRILVDGVPLEEWDVRALRRQFGLVQQDLFLFSTDLYHNVALFEEPAEETVLEALEASQAAKVVEKYEQGLRHTLGERGSSLSQGERQLLSFARALAVDPPVLILDEATASVDSKTEQRIQEALRGILRGRTAVVVAHRLSTVQEADRILVLKKGVIVEQGRHAELLDRNGLYAHLYRTGNV